MIDQEINKAVARKLGTYKITKHPMGLTETYPDYCHSIEAAWEIVDKCSYFCLVKPLKNENWKCDIGREDQIIVQWANTVPMAICKAFLKLEDK